MKRILFLLFVFSWLFSAATSAQTNTSYENAQQITPGQNVISVFTPGSVESLWYKVDVTAGQWYEKRCTGMTYYSSYDANTQMGTEVPTTYYNYSYNGFVGCGFKAEENATCYVHVTYFESIGSTLDWKLDVVSDNRICELATNCILGETITLPTTQQKYRWYKIALEKDKYYRFDATNAHLNTFNICNVSDQGNPLMSGNHIYKATADVELYIGVESIKEQATLAVTETAPVNNTTSTAAAPLTIGKTIEYSYALGLTQWYKFDAVAGKTYDIETNYYHQQGVNAINIYKSDGASLLATGQIYKKLLRISAPETGTLYVRLDGRNDGDLKYLTVTEVNDNRICFNAAPLMVGETVSYTHETLKELWWKVELEAGNTYLTDFTNGYNSNASLQVYKSCDDTTPLKKENKEFIFTPSEAGLYYFKAYTQYNFNDYPTNTFTIVKIENEGNNSCDKAKTIDVGEKIITFQNFGDKLWYKVAVEAGKTYQMNGSQIPRWTSWNISSFIYEQCGSNQEVLPWHDPLVYYISPDKNTTYYVAWQGNTDVDAFYRWSFDEVTDNRICQNAVQVSVGENITVPPYSEVRGANNYWFKINLKGEKVYELDFTQGVSQGWSDSDNYVVYGECGGQGMTAVKKSKQLYTTPNDSTIYLQFSRCDTGKEPIVWSISETQGDNRLCEFATQATLDNPITVSHTEYDTQWYKIDLIENVLYEVNLPETVDYENINIYNKCGVKNNEWNAFGYANTFIFTSDSIRGEYYIKFSNFNKVESFNCTLTEVKDNRTCIYSTEAVANDTIAVAGKFTRWFNVALNADAYYEFDFTTGEGNVSGEIYAACGETISLIKGRNERILFKPTATDTYFVKMEEISQQQEEWSWAYRAQPAGDNRLCEYATPVTTDTTTVEFKDGIKEHWYTVNLKVGKYYELGSGISEGGRMIVEYYKACNQNTAFASGNWVYAPEEDVTFYVKTATSTTSNFSNYWYVREVEPDGRFCGHSLPVAVGQEVETGNLHATIYFPKQQWGTGSGSWYRFSVDKAGIYEIRMEGWEAAEENGHFGYWEMWVFEDCSLDSIVATCGHTFNTGRRRFNVNSDKEYKIFVSNWGGYDPARWKIIEIEAPSSVLNVSLAQEDGTILNAQNANVILYQKNENGLFLTDTLTYSGMEGNTLFKSKEISYGTYLLYAENIGKGFDFKTYLPGWYQDAGIWEDATEINLHEASMHIEFRLNAAPADIVNGDVTISGKVSSSEGGSGNVEDISICFYREKTEQQQATARHARAISFRVVSNVQWELVATVKTDANGDYKVDKLPAGRYKMLVDLPGYNVADGGKVLDVESGKDYIKNDFEINEKTKSIQSVPMGIENIEFGMLKMYPNPVTSELYIQKYSGDENVQIFDLLGREVTSRKLLDGKLNVSALPNGIYILKIGNYKGRFIKE